MKTLEQLQEPQSLRLAMGELRADELRIAQAAVRYAYFHLRNADLAIPERKTFIASHGGPLANEQYVEGWNDCRAAMMAAKES